MAGNYQLDANDRTFLYILYIDSIRATDGSMLTPTEVVMRWYADDQNDCSEKFSMDSTSTASPRYCAFMVASFADRDNRQKEVTLTLSVGNEHLAADFLDLCNFSTEEAFKDHTVELKSESGVLATLELHTAAQRRYADGPVVPQETIYFVQPATDTQANYLYQHIIQETDVEPDASSANATAEADAIIRQSQLEEEERKRLALEAEAAQKQQRNADEQRRREEEDGKKRDAEALDRKTKQEEEDRQRRRDEEDKLACDEKEKREAAAREKEIERERETDREKQQAGERQREMDRDRQSAEQRRKEDEDKDKERWRREDEERDKRRNDDMERERETRRKEEEDSRRDRGASMGGDRAGGDRRQDSPRQSPPRDSSGGGRFAEEDRRRQEEEDRWRRQQRERDDELRERQRREEAERWQEGGLRERRTLEEERERLRQDAKRERAREASERERRAQERRKHQENTAARLGADGAISVGDSMSSRAPTPSGTLQFSNSRAATPGGPAPVADSRGTTPRRQGNAVSPKKHSPAATPKQRTPQATHFAHTAVEQEAQRQEHRPTIADQPHMPKNHPQPEPHRGAQSQQPGGDAALQKRWPSHRAHPGAPIPGLGDYDAGYDSEASEPNPFEGDALTRDEEQGCNCGAVFQDDAMFCLKCGAPRPNACVCGCILKDDAAFCRKCGLPRAQATDPRLRSMEVPLPAARKTRTVAARAHHPHLSAASVPSPARSRAVTAPAQQAQWLEHLKTQAMSGAVGGLWTVGDVEELGVPAGTAEAGSLTTADGAGLSGVDVSHGSPPSSRQRSPLGSHMGMERNLYSSNFCNSRSRGVEVSTQTASTLADTPAARSVLAAALQDAAASEGGDFDHGPRGSAPVAAVEEGLLRLLVLQKQLRVTEPEDASHRTALADAAAGLVPRMLQVLEVARGVCEANRTKLNTFCQERDMDLEKLGGEGPGAYMQAQLSALDRLSTQYASMLPGAASGRPPALPSEVFQTRSRSATPTKAIGSGPGSVMAWSEVTSSHGNLPQLLPGSPPRVHASPAASPQPIASYASSGYAASSGPMLHEPPSASRGSGALDPSSDRPSAPMLQGGGGGSSPPPAKFREAAHQARSPGLPMTHGGPSLSGPLGSPPGNYQRELRPDHQYATSSSTPASSEMGKLEHQAALQREMSRLEHPSLQRGLRVEQHASSSSTLASTEFRRLEHIGVVTSAETNAAASAMWGSHQAAPLNEFGFGNSGASTPLRGVSPTPRIEGEQARPELPLRLLRAAAEHASVPTRRPASRQRTSTPARSIAGGAHAAAGSPSPERERAIESESSESKLAASEPSPRLASRGRGAERVEALAARKQQLDERPSSAGRVAGPPEDKYFKILQNLQAKGAVGARGKLLEGAGQAARERRENRMQALSDSAGPSDRLTRHDFSKPWTPVSRNSPAVASTRPSQRRRLAADSESDDSLE